MKKQFDGRTHTGMATNKPNLKSILAAIEFVRGRLQFAMALTVIDDKVIEQVAKAAFRELSRRANRNLDGFENLQNEILEIVNKIAPKGTPFFRWTNDVRKEKIK